MSNKNLGSLADIISKNKKAQEKSLVNEGVVAVNESSKKLEATVEFSLNNVSNLQLKPKVKLVATAFRTKPSIKKLIKDIAADAGVSTGQVYNVLIEAGLASVK